MVKQIYPVANHELSMSGSAGKPGYTIDGLTREERDLLVARLAQHRSPARRVAGMVRKGVIASLLLYAANGLLQTSLLLYSPSFRDARAALREGRTLAVMLAEDLAFRGLLKGYILVKRRVNEGFDRHYRHFAFHYERAVKGRGEVMERVERAYNPLSYFLPDRSRPAGKAE